MDFNKSLQALDFWIENESYRGWDPYDALNSPLLKRLSRDRHKIGQLWVQVLKRLPINLRPLLGIKKTYNPKGMGLFLGTYLRKYQSTHSATDLQKARFFSDWIAENQSEGWSGACWGYHFDWPNRGFFAPAGTPTVVNTAFIGLSLLDDYQTTGNRASLEIARSACEFILRDLNHLSIDDEESCLSYTPFDQRYVHNANVLGAWLLAEVYCHTEEKELARAALSNAHFTLHRQSGDGTWPYGLAANDQWIDSFHTGYVVVGLNRIGKLLKQPAINMAAERGYQAWQKQFFTKKGVAKYYLGRVFPIDIHVISQGILTHLEFQARHPEAREKAIRLAKWGIDHFQHRDGYFYYQQYPFYKIRIPFMRWSQAWMQRALTELLPVA